MRKIKLALVLGTRPEIIKMAPVIRACETKGLDFYIIHSNQHYSHEMDAAIFRDLRLPAPQINLEVGSGTHGQQTGRILERVEAALMQNRPDFVLVHGDVNTTLAGALAARKLLISVGHVEAGLRSFDSRMPEEVNRVLVDHISDLCFAPTETARGNIVREGILPEKIFVTGNTVVDACLEHSQLQEGLSQFRALSLPERFLLLTLHRPENTDDPERFAHLIRSLDGIARERQLPIYYPIHPRTRGRLEQMNMRLPQTFIAAPPLGYLCFLQIIRNATLVLTDSGGIQEEACILQRPCVTLRENTERPETVEVGANVIAGVQEDGIKNAVAQMFALPKVGGWKQPYGDGKAGSLIVELIMKKMSVS